MKREFWKNKRVFITGHTGLVGGWLAVWLTNMGAKVYGYGLVPGYSPSFFNLTDLGLFIDQSEYGDILNHTHIGRAMKAAEPEIVFHLAAQPLVLEGYENPELTFNINVMGTVNFFAAVRNCPSIKSVVVVTSDKCYEEQNSLYGYRETDRLGGPDPYSASKACAEIVTSAYRNAFFQGKVRVSSVRAGNIIGGGDYTRSRLVPDVIESLTNETDIILRNPDAIRPWQFVLEPIAGYLTVAERGYTGLHGDGDAWNFGPRLEGDIAVDELVDRIMRCWGRLKVIDVKVKEIKLPQHENMRLVLDSSKAYLELGWRSRLSTDLMLELTVNWYQQALTSRKMLDFTLTQIHYYERLL